MTLSFRRAGLLAATVAVSAASCSGSLFESKIAPPTVYVLRQTLPAKASGIDADLTIDRPQLGPGLDNSRIAAEFADRRLDYFANANWSADLGDVLQSFAVQSFQRSSGLRSVAADSSRFAGAYRLELTFSEFAAQYAGEGGLPTIKVALYARLGLAGHVLPGGNFNVEAERPAASKRLSAIVAAYEEATNAAFAELIAGTMQVIAVSPAKDK